VRNAGTMGTSKRLAGLYDVYANEKHILEIAKAAP
jgi:hypothetical protein